MGTTTRRREWLVLSDGAGMVDVVEIFGKIEKVEGPRSRRLEGEGKIKEIYSRLARVQLYEFIQNITYNT